MKVLSGIVLLACCPALAQTYIVDAANGPGAHFTAMPTAIANVPDGAELQVRAGSYGSFTIGQGLSVSFEYLAVVDDVVITGTLPQQTVVLRGLQTDSGSLSVTNCLGLVVLDECVGIGGTGLRLNTFVCDQLYATLCRFGLNRYGASLFATNAVFRGCQFYGSIALQETASRIQLVDSQMAAGSLWPAFSSGPSIWMNGGDVRIVGGSCHAWQHPCISGTGSLRIHPNVAFTQMPVIIEPTIQTVVTEMPAVLAMGGALGGTVYAQMSGAAGELGVLLVGFPGPALQLPGFADPFWLQPGSAWTCAVETSTTAWGANVAYPIPNSPAFRGLRLAWQAATFSAANGLQASNPAITTHW